MTCYLVYQAGRPEFLFLLRAHRYRRITVYGIVRLYAPFLQLDFEGISATISFFKSPAVDGDHDALHPQPVRLGCAGRVTVFFSELVICDHL